MPASPADALAPARVAVVAPHEWADGVAARAAELVGASVSDQEPAARVVVAGSDVVVDPGPPTFVIPEGTGAAAAERAAAVFSALARVHATAVPPQAARSFTFADRPELWPFGGLRLDEAVERPVAALDPTADVVPLVTAHHGAVVVRSAHAPVTLSFAPLPAGVRLLRDELTPDRFLGLLPLVHALRLALGRGAWNVPGAARAAFVVDDPNLRRERYGYLDLRAVARAASERNYHLAVAMIPLDFRKTRPAAALLFREHPEALSIVVHGVDHTKREFESPVTPAEAESALVRALRRMEEHEQQTGVAFARALTFPHGVCNRTWMTAMLRVPLDGVVVSRAFPFAADEEIDDPLYELLPAQMSFGGLPIVNRFKAEEPVERLLFQAWLGKPLIVYTHHEFFRGGLDRLHAVADFLNRTVKPAWSDLGAILERNYQLRDGEAGPVARLFSNRVTVATEASRLAAVVKPGATGRGERAWTSGGELPLEPVPGTGLVARDVDVQGGVLTVELSPDPPPPAAVPLSAPLRSRLRRLATELRDQARAAVAR